MKFNSSIGIFFALLSGLVQATNTFDLPDIGDSSGSVISPEFERRLGQTFLRNVRQHAKVLNDPEINAYVRSIGYRLIANSHNSDMTFTFIIVDNPAINAFAAPGGIIGINSGTILASRNESELAAVLAHEVAHITQRHIARGFEKSNQSSLPAAAALLGSILLGIINPEAGAAALTVVTGARLQTQINFTRKNEEEADSVGMQLLVRSDYDPYGMPAFFERLQKKSEYSQNSAPEFLRTHPLTLSRIAESKARANEYPKLHYKNTTSYELTRTKLEVQSYKNHTDAIAAFEHYLSTDVAEKKSAVRYGYVLALTRDGQYSQAREQLNTLLSWENDNINYLIAAANIELQQKNYDAAQNILRDAHALYPDYKPLVFIYAKSLVDNQQAASALSLLRRYKFQEELDPAYYDLLAQAEAQNGSVANSAIAKAEYLYLTGSTKSALEQLTRVKESNTLDYYQQEIITSKIEKLEYALKLEEEFQI